MTHADRTIPIAALIVLAIAGAGSALAEDTEWAKLKELKSGTELRIIRQGGRPVVGTLDEVNDERLAVATKSQQFAIPKNQIVRVDFRPGKPEGRVTKETKTTDAVPGAGAPPLQGQPRNEGSSTSATSTMSFGSKADFVTVYRRTASTPHK